MKLHDSAPSGVQRVTAYGADYVAVNGVRYDDSIVLLPERVHPWGGRTFAALTAEDFAFLRTLEAEIVLLGTGARQRFPHPSPFTKLLSSHCSASSTLPLPQRIHSGSKP